MISKCLRMKHGAGMVYLLRRAWHILVLRILPLTSVQRHDLLYAIPDPWALDNAKERHRIRHTSRLIAENIGICGTLLEVGCGEGLQSETLRGNCNGLIGVDISARAVARAALRVRDAEFHVTDVYSDALPFAIPVDLVVACEMIYLLADVEAAVDRLERLGRMCLITYMDEASPKLKAILRTRSLMGRETIRRADLTWHVVWWRSPHVGEKRARVDRPMLAGV